MCEGNTPIRAVFGAMECEIDFLEMFDAVEDQPTAKSLILPEDSGEQLAQCSSTDVPNVQMRTHSSQFVEVDPFAGTMALRTTSTRTKLSWKQCPKALSWYRHFCKARKKNHSTESSVLDALIELQKKHKTGKRSVVFNVKRLRRRDPKSEICKRSLVFQAKLKSGAGNQHVRRFSMTDFLEVAFGEKDNKKHFHSTTNIAKHFNMSDSMVRMMRTTVAASVVTKQIKLAARMFALCKAKQPTTVSVRHAWDETAQDIQAKLTGASSSRSAWKVMVQKVSVLIFWDTCTISMDFVSLCERFSKALRLFFPESRAGLN